MSFHVYARQAFIRTLIGFGKSLRIIQGSPEHIASKNRVGQVWGLRVKSTDQKVRGRFLVLKSKYLIHKSWKVIHKMESLENGKISFWKEHFYCEWETSAAHKRIA